jgi:hypothetical protein
MHHRRAAENSPASLDEVLSHLPATSIAHFACHGQQNTRSPLKRALILQDGQLEVSQIMQQSMPNALLAFLSACESDEKLPDEVIHLGATLLFCGFRWSCRNHVVSKQYYLGNIDLIVSRSIADADGPKIAFTMSSSKRMALPQLLKPPGLIPPERPKRSKLLSPSCVQKMLYVGSHLFTLGGNLYKFTYVR